jgi:hypothetical protein
VRRASLERVIIRRMGATMALCALAVGCSSGDDDTLVPLPIEGGTAAPSPTVIATAPASLPTSTTSTTVAISGVITGSTVKADGDWDGARFDVGTISALTKVGSQDAISYDRWSYDAPDGTRRDALTFQAEPVVAWWRTSPFVNVQVRNRTFILSPDVEVLIVDPAGHATACADPPPSPPPAPSWTAATDAALTDPANTGTVAILTYGVTGEVTRIRLTRGC